MPGSAAQEYIRWAYENPPNGAMIACRTLGHPPYRPLPPGPGPQRLRGHGEMMTAQPSSQTTFRRQVLAASALILLALSLLLPVSPAEAHAGTGFCSNQNLPTAYFVYAAGTGAGHYHRWQFLDGTYYNHPCPI